MQQKKTIFHSKSNSSHEEIRRKGINSKSLPPSKEKDLSTRGSMTKTPDIPSRSPELTPRENQRLSLNSNAVSYIKRNKSANSEMNSSIGDINYSSGKYVDYCHACKSTKRKEDSYINLGLSEINAEIRNFLVVIDE